MLENDADLVAMNTGEQPRYRAGHTPLTPIGDLPGRRDDLQVAIVQFWGMQRGDVALEGRALQDVFELLKNP